MGSHKGASMKYILSWILFLAFSSAFAADITKVKGNKALINLDGLEAAEGDVFFAIDSNGKKKGIIKIDKVKGDKAIGAISKGKAQVGWTLTKRGPKAAGDDSVTPSSKSTKGFSASNHDTFIGAMVGYGMDSAEVTLDSGDVASLSGSGISAKGFFDYKLFPNIWFRGFGGIENFNGTGGNVCTGGATCDVKIMYITFDFWGRYVFSDKEFRPWLGGGFTLLFPMTKSSTAIVETSITTTSTYGVGGGADWFISKDSFIPMSVEYQLFPSSNQAKASIIALRVGYGMSF